MHAADLGFEVADRAVYLPDVETLVLADLHLGRDVTSPVDLSLGEREAIGGRLTSLLDRFDPAEVVFAGDVVHAFSHVPRGIRDAFSDLRDRVSAAGASLTVVRGNHDAMLEELTSSVPEHRLHDGTVVCHGHEPPSSGGDRYVIGHDHPAIRIEGKRHPCYLFGESVYRGRHVLCLPAFNELARGTTVAGLSAFDGRSPLLAGIDAFRPIVHDPDADETFVFPPLESIRSYLRPV